MPFLSFSEDSSQRKSPSTYTVVTIPTPFRFRWCRTECLLNVHTESTLCTTNISVKVTVLSIVI